jgi:hypothetical protein
MMTPAITRKGNVVVDPVVADTPSFESPVTVEPAVAKIATLLPISVWVIPPTVEAPDNTTTLNNASGSSNTKP